MTENYSFAEKKRIRKSFEKISSVMSLPDILEIQTDSYKHFLQEETLADKRKDQGLMSPVLFRRTRPSRHSPELSLMPWCACIMIRDTFQ